MPQRYMARRLKQLISTNCFDARRFGRNPKRRYQQLQLRLEELEPRLLLATLTWTGALNANWNDGTAGVLTNWSGNALPKNNDTLIFGAVALHLTNVNNTTAN